MATDELTDAWFITVNWTGGNTIYYLCGADGGTHEGEIWKSLAKAEFQLLSDKQSELDDQEGRKRVTVVMRKGKANARWVAGSIPSSVPLYSSPHKYYRKDSDYAQTVEALEKVGFVKQDSTESH